MIGTIGFAVEGVIILALAVRGYRDRHQFATLGEILDRVMATRAARITLLTFWWWLGWHFFVVQTVDPTH
jgi:Family of unknown function (DUF6186)